MPNSTYRALPSTASLGRTYQGSWLDLTLLCLLILASTGFTYMWLWRFPYWLWLCFATGGLLLVPRFLLAAHAVVLACRWRIILPWAAFLSVVILRDWFAGALEGSLTDRVLLNAVALLLFGVCAILAYQCDWRRVLVMIGAIGFVYGIVAIGQFLGTYVLWTLPDMLSTYSSRDMALERNVHAAISAEDFMAGFERVGRVRAFDIYVHKFSAYQGIISAMMISMAITLWWSERRHYLMMGVVAIGAIVSTIGVLLTFSRAPILGLLGVLVVVFWFAGKRRNLSPLVGFFIFAAALVATAISLRLDQAEQFGRIFEMSSTGGADAGRLETWLYSLRQFVSNPLIGVGSGGMDNAELVTHSVPLRILGDFGLIGFFCYAAVWFGLFRLAWMTFRKRSVDSSLVGLVMIAGLIVAALDNLTHSSGLLQRDTSQAALFGVGYGLCLRALRSVPNIQGSGPLSAGLAARVSSSLQPRPWPGRETAIRSQLGGRK